MTKVKERKVREFLVNILVRKKENIQCKANVYLDKNRPPMTRISFRTGLQVFHFDPPFLNNFTSSSFQQNGFGSGYINQHYFFALSVVTVVFVRCPSLNIVSGLLRMCCLPLQYACVLIDRLLKSTILELMIIAFVHVYEVNLCFSNCLHVDLHVFHSFTTR